MIDPRRVAASAEKAPDGAVAASTAVAGAADPLERVLEVARRLAASSDTQEILSLIIDALRDLLGAERATVFRLDHRTGDLYTSVGHGLESTADVDADPMAGGRRSAPQSTVDAFTSGQVLRFPSTLGLAGDCCSKRTIVNVPDCARDPRFTGQLDRLTGFVTRNMLCIPLIATDGTLVGVAQVLNKAAALGPFTPVDERMAGALAAHAAIALHRTELLAAERRKKKMDRDLALARVMQRATWPKNLPKPRGYDLAAYSEPADETGGDAYDVVAMDEGDVSGGSDDATRFLLLMADATGHGIGPALSVIQVRAMVRMAVRCGARLAQVCESVNRQLCEDLPTGRFVTAFIGGLDAEAHRIEYHAAGQGPILHYKAAGEGAIDARPATGIPFGIDGGDGTEMCIDTIDLSPGDLFVLLSDGFYEAVNPAKELFGMERVQVVLRGSAAKSARQILDDITAAVDAFADGVPLADDCTAIILKRL